jgi:hypothetical protein
MQNAAAVPGSAPVHGLLIGFSAISFLGFGLACFLWPPMKAEYVRYGVSRFQPLVGLLQVAGAVGLLTGFAVPLVGQLAAGGLALLMFFGACLRKRIKDSVAQTLPAILYMVLNIYLAVEGFN